MKRLVIYYSYTGNTKKIALMLKDKLNCDILELEPKVPFSNDYDEVVSEYQNNSINNKVVEIKDINLNISEYDEIIIGTPVWWYTMCPVITTFLKQYDLTNKTIYPFATNAGWLGHIFVDFKKLCSNSTLKDGMNIVFSSTNLDELVTSEDEIEKWIKEL